MPEVPGGTILERAHFTCCHCNAVVIMNPGRTRPREYCAKCDHWTCDKPVCATECNPIMQSIDLALKYEATLVQPFLLRGAAGEVLFDKTLADKERIF